MIESKSFLPKARERAVRLLSVYGVAAIRRNDTASAGCAVERLMCLPGRMVLCAGGTCRAKR
jgi:hypothetical protein